MLATVAVTVGYIDVDVAVKVVEVREVDVPTEVTVIEVWRVDVCAIIETEVAVVVVLVLSVDTVMMV